jgi:hypothetical protein
MFYDSGGYDNTIEPYDINMDIDTILINTTRTKATIIPCECWNQISINSCTIWRQIPTEDCTIILEGYPDDTVSGLMDLTPPSSRGCNWDTFSHTRDRTGVHKVHFSNQANDQTAATESISGTSQPNLIDYINDHLCVDFDTLQVQVVARKKDQAISQGKHPHFHPSKHLPSSGSTTAHPGDVCCLISDDNTICNSSLTPGQKYIAKAANLGLDEVEYDSVTYKFTWQSL